MGKSDAISGRGLVTPGFTRGSSRHLLCLSLATKPHLTPARWLRDVFPSQRISGRKFQNIGPARWLFDAAHFFQQRSGPLQLRVLATYTFTSPFPSTRPRKMDSYSFDFGGSCCRPAGTSEVRKSGRLQSNFWNFFPENRFWSLGWGLALPCFPTPTEKVRASQAGMFKVCLVLFRERKLI